MRVRWLVRSHISNGSGGNECTHTRLGCQIANSPILAQFMENDKKPENSYQTSMTTDKM